MFKHISGLLDNFIKQDDEWKIKLFNNWDKVIGKLKNKVIILKIENHLIVLGVTHPAWAQELFILSDVLKRRINSLFEKEQIKYIRFKTLKFKIFKNKKFNKKTKDFHIDKKEINKKLILTKKEYESLTKIKDVELKQALKSFCFRCKGP